MASPEWMQDTLVGTVTAAYPIANFLLDMPVRFEIRIVGGGRCW
jgi:hypothetical protein